MSDTAIIATKKTSLRDIGSASQLSVYRDKETEEYRWFIITGTSTLNRDGEIDSRQLFDNFIKRAQKSGIYPYYTFFHLGEDFKIGEADFLARDGSVYMASGTWEDHELARSAREVLEQDEEQYWGASNRFAPIGKPYFLKVGEEKIPVYRDGVHIEISMLPEAYACSLFTQSSTETLEVNRMNSKVTEALARLFKGDEEKVKKYAEKVDEINRTIEEEGILERSSEEAQTEELLPAPTEEPAVEAVPAEESEVEIVLDDSAVERISASVLEKMDFSALQSSLEALAKQQEEAVSRMAEMEKIQADIMRDIVSVAEALNEQDEKARQRWESDLPKQPTAKVTYRPREEAKGDDAKPTFADIAAGTLSALK
jgi:hypothetical protein